MLIKYYNPIKLKTINNDCISKDMDNYDTYKNIKYPTRDLSELENIPKAELFKMMDEQYKLAESEAGIHLKYAFISEHAYKSTLAQYNDLFYHDGFFYKKELIKNYVSMEENRFNTYTKQPEIDNIQSSLTPPHPLLFKNDNEDNDDFGFLPEITKNYKVPKKKIVKISRSAIRNITGYSSLFYPSREDNPQPVHVIRQDELIEDQSTLILVLGSRQIGKSYSIAEKAVEESYIPNNDILVGAFVADSTKLIKNYILRFIRNFPEDEWSHNKSERFIQNMQTGSKVYFRTLADDAVDAVRGLTLNTVIVDEAQKVSEYAYEEVLRPTLATTGGKMILIGTPPKNPNGYFVESILKYKKGELPKASYYEIPITAQPFTHPDAREDIMLRTHEPRIQREWFCNLTTDVELLFDIAKVDNPDSYYGHYILGIDPARKADRSAYSLVLVQNGKAYIIESGFVPDVFKKDWKLQTVYYKKIIEKYKKYGQITTVIDSSGVGDGVMNIFQQSGLQINYSVRYTSGSTKSLKNTDYTVSKSILINNTLDLIGEDLVGVIEKDNKFLLEEISYIYETESRSGLIGFTSKFYDDITNATMIALFITSEKRLIQRSLHKTSEFRPLTNNPMIDGIERRGPVRKISSNW